MILSDIKHYLSKRGYASLSDLSLHFDTNPNAMRGMLTQWIKKGRVIKHTKQTACNSSCNKCNTQDGETYKWIDANNSSFKGINIKSSQ
jgi:hypothetical protein